ncbi:MAG: hypothetical protein IKS52_11370 [Clostridia bacterium]|nr:hypothetical protein [Clostridia bacterium]
MTRRAAGIRVLFVGNSHTYMNDMPRLFQDVYENTTGDQAEVSMLAFSGRHLGWHIDEFFSLRFALLYGGFDYCVLQQAAHPFPPEEESLADGARALELCRAGGVTPVFYMTWAEKRFPENQRKMIDTYEKLHALGPSLLAPVGVVWQAVREAHPEIELYAGDGEHASPQGDLLVASVLCAAIAGTADVALPDHMLDFKANAPAGKSPRIVMSPEAAVAPLDGRAAAVIREEIAKRGDLFRR